MLLKTVLAVSTLAFCAQANAQVFKCKDAAGKITYASRACSEIGLGSAGEVKGDINMIPANKAAPATATGPAPVAAAAPAPKKPASAQASDDDGRRCFVTTKVVKTPKGNQSVQSTRCNDEPEAVKK